MFLVAVALLSACSGPKDTVIPADANRWESDLRPTLDQMSGEDKRLIVSYLARMKQATAFGGQAVPPGTTVGQAINAERTFQKEDLVNRGQTRDAQDQRERERAEAERQVSSIVTISLVSKEILPTNVAGGGPSQQAALTFELRNVDVANRNVTSINGVLRLSDTLFGRELKTIQVNDREGLPAGATRSWQTLVPLSQQATTDERMRNSDLRDIKVVFDAESLQLADGTTLQFPVNIGRS
ncbi:MAG: hypothetical protein HW416_1030 [Chloroflexi bacterium]|nr:hypothetical protein [Chloroflexota bacterium]